MKKVKLEIVGMIEKEVSVCPYCGGTPIVEVGLYDMKNNPFKSDRISHQTVTCGICGLSASINVWESICSKIKSPIVPDEETPDLE